MAHGIRAERGGDVRLSEQTSGIGAGARIDETAEVDDGRHGPR